MSASKMRQAVEQKDFTKFSQGLPRNMSNTEAKRLYNSVRMGMGLKEQKIFQKYFNSMGFLFYFDVFDIFIDVWV